MITFSARVLFGEQIKPEFYESDKKRKSCLKLIM
jgi:hypothetical protein